MTEDARGAPRLLAGPHNARLGAAIHAFNLPAEPDICAGATPTCEAACYAKDFLFRIQHRRHRANHERSLTDQFPGEMIAEIRRAPAAVVRIHVSGDFYDAAYVARWARVARACPQATFFAYTRSWRQGAILAALTGLARLPNVWLWFSEDRDTGRPPSVPGIRRAYLLAPDEPEADVPADADLVFRVPLGRRPGHPHAYARPAKRANGVLICPKEQGIARPVELTCSSCRICFSGRGPRAGAIEPLEADGGRPAIGPLTVPVAGRGRSLSPRNRPRSRGQPPSSRSSSMTDRFVHLRLERPLAILDTEATGVDPRSDRIVEVAVLRLDPGAPPDRYRSRIHPGVPIPPAASAVHGIRDDDVADAPHFRAIAPGLLSRLADADLAGFGLKHFDLPLLQAEFARAGIAFDPAGHVVVDVLRLYHAREPRDLAAAVRRYCRRDHDAAHGALADVEATAAALDAMIAAHDDLPATVAGLAAASPDLDVAGRFRLEGGRACFASGRHRGRPLDEVARHDPGYLHWLLRAGCFADARALVRDALDRADAEA